MAAWNGSYNDTWVPEWYEQWYFDEMDGWQCTCVECVCYDAPDPDFPSGVGLDRSNRFYEENWYVKNHQHEVPWGDSEGNWNR